MECSPYVLAASVLANVQAALGETRGGPAARVAVYPHPAPALEFGCDMAWVGVGRIVPAQGGKVSVCATVWQLDLTVGVARCYPVAPDNGPPDAAAVDSATRDVLDDGEAMRRAVVDAFADDTFTITGWAPQSPQGGVHASTMTVTVQLNWGMMVEPRSPMLPGDPRA